MITLTVGANKLYPSIQAAVDAVVNSVNGGTLSQSVEIIVYEGNYGGFVVPNNSLGTSSTATFTVKAAVNSRVLLSGWQLSGMLGHGHRGVGIGIGDNNPYVTIKGLYIENFHKGIVLGTACHYSNVLSNYTRLNSNVGVWIYRSEFCEVVNNVILDHDNGLVCSDIDDVFIANNDIVNLTDPPGSLQGDKYCIYLTSLAPSTYGSGGAIILYNNNVIASGGGNLIGYGPNVLPKLRSDNNNLHNPSGVYAHDLTVGSVTPDALNLSAWQSISSTDAGSISSYPQHYVPSQAGNSIFTSVILDNFISFSGVARGLSLANTATASTAGSALIAHGTVPSYVDSSQLALTIQSNFSGGLSNSRPAIASIGAYDINNDTSGFGSTVLPVGVAGTGVNGLSCIGKSTSGINLVEHKYGQSVDCINPSLVPGFFYIRDIQHYLYSSKSSHYLADISATDIVLASPLYSDVKIFIDDSQIPDTHWKVDGNILRVYHSGLSIDDLDRQIVIKATILRWVDDGFQKRDFKQVTRIRDGEMRYFLPDIPTRAAPMVITDDKISYSDDAEFLGWEFSDVWNAEEEKVEIIFAGSRNLFENPQFDYHDTGSEYSLSWFTGGNYSPDNWGIPSESGAAIIAPRVVTTSTGLIDVLASGQLTAAQTQDGSIGDMMIFTGTQHEYDATGAYNLYPIIGENLCVVTGHGITQRIRINEDKPYWISTYAASLKDTGSSDTLITGSLLIDVDFYDIEMRSLVGSISTGYDTVTNYEYPTGHWTRYSLMVSTQADNTLNKTGTVVPSSIPTNAHYMDVTIGSTGACAIDATAVTQSIDMQSYTRRLRGYEATIEYDTGITDLYHATDLTVTPIRNVNHNGFVYIAGVPAWQFDTGAPIDCTTLTDWYWATGRLDHLPWARTSGKNKLRNRSSFHLTTDGQTEDVTIAPDISYPDQIQIVPRVPVSTLFNGVSQIDRLSDAGTDIGVKGSDFTVKVIDDNGNPYAFEWVTAKVVDDLKGLPGANYVGLLGHKEMGFYREFNQSINVQLDSAGSAVIRWVPPSAEDALYEISNPVREIKVENGEKFVDNLPYRANEVGMANVFMSTPSNPTGYPSYAGSDTTQYISPIMGPDVDGISVYSLASTPCADTMRVWINHTGVFPYTGSYTGSYAGELSDSFDYPLSQSEIPEINQGQYFVDEARRMLFIRSSHISNDVSRSAVVRFRERSSYLLAGEDGVVDDRKLFISDSMYSTLTGEVTESNPLSIGYDILVDLLVIANSPAGISYEFEEIVEAGAAGGFSIQNIRERVLNSSMVGNVLPIRVGLG